MSLFYWVTTLKNGFDIPFSRLVISLRSTFPNAP
ncbi:hypothetical protein SAMN05444359_1102 [Neolewinella agarilytica]|uniref:Uncharacterized protein n=1 Tax=Neolewinella agarilytica TaxID=478744 RepID=A0A1H9G1J2_9BACT|nr:hypothetical protein SAMN05444359_1102 [Neolewinella agarilytica]